MFDLITGELKHAPRHQAAPIEIASEVPAPDFDEEGTMAGVEGGVPGRVCRWSRSRRQGARVGSSGRSGLSCLGGERGPRRHK